MGPFGIVLWALHTSEQFFFFFAHVQRKCQPENLMNCLTHLSSFVHSSSSLEGVRESGTESGTARTPGTTGCACWCWAWASGSSHRRRRPLRTAASQWGRPQPPVRIPPPPRLGLPSHRCREEHTGHRTSLSCVDITIGFSDQIKLLIEEIRINILSAARQVSR